MHLLILNAGSSSLKSSLYALPEEQLPSEPQLPLWSGSIDWTHTAGQAELSVKTAAGRSLTTHCTAEDRTAVTQTLLQTLWQGETQVIAGPEAIDAVGHRVVHGGSVYRDAVMIDETVVETIRSLIPLAPVHNPVNLEGIAIAQTLLGQTTPQFAIFDTAFHHTIPDAAAIYPGPYTWVKQGIRRYGFHGISHEYCAQRAAQLLDIPLKQLRLITCHLGNGCSLTAVHQGQSVDTTMGFTPLDGLMMGSRSGSVDPGILLYLLRQSDLSVDELDRQLNRESGLQGISGVSNDLRAVQGAIAQGNERAALALDIYIHRICRNIGSMVASLGGVDAVVFTGGVGEHSAEVRSRVCQSFQFLGLALDTEANANPPKAEDSDIATAASAVRVLVIHTQEDWQMARTCWRSLHDGA